MPHQDFANSTQILMLTKVVDDHCVRHGIHDPATREIVAARAYQLFQNGVVNSVDIAANLHANAIRYS